MGDAGDHSCGQWHAVWAKTIWDEHGGRRTGSHCHQHLADAAGVAGLLVDEWLSPQVTRRIARELPDGEAGVRTLAVWLAAVHDVGKASPAFVAQVPKLAGIVERHGLPVGRGTATDPERSVVSHALVGHVAVRDWLLDDLALARRGPTSGLASVVGSHHGLPPAQSQLAAVGGRPDLAGRGTWTHARRDALAWAVDLVGGPEALRAYDGVVLSLPAQVLLSAVVIVADWIASNPEHFPLRPVHTAHGPPIPPDAQRSADRLVRGWESVAFPPRWSAIDTGSLVDDLLRRRFDRGDARPVQAAAVATARTVWAAPA